MSVRTDGHTHNVFRVKKSLSIPVYLYIYVVYSYFNIISIDDNLSTSMQVKSAYHIVALAWSEGFYIRASINFLIAYCSVTMPLTILSWLAPFVPWRVRPESQQHDVTMATICS